LHINLGDVGGYGQVAVLNREVWAHIGERVPQLIYLSQALGRTGTVIGCWLIDNEALDYESVLRRLQHLQVGTRQHQGNRTSSVQEAELIAE
jgi:hypothetical protein